MSKSKALLLFSGGLDSVLAVRILESQNIFVSALCFTSNFFSDKEAQISAKANNINLEILNISEEILEIVKNPKNGHGKCMNPCIDCHAFMISKAREKLIKENYDFIATGEVLGQRPFSQNKISLEKVQSIAGIEVLRPLSARLLAETEIEKKGLVSREKLEDISGRTRERQIELAKSFEIKYYPSPAGGCLLTDPQFSNRLREMIERQAGCTPKDIELIKYGRVFWVDFEEDKKNFSFLLIIGRHKEDNEVLEKLAEKGDIMIKLKEIPGPVGLIRFLDSSLLENISLNNFLEIPEKLEENFLKNEINLKNILEKVQILTAWYSTKARGKRVEFEI